MTAAALQRAWQRFICRACGLVYDEAKGDADSGLAPGTRFDDIPDDWACPLCGVTKADFEPFDAAPVDRTAARRSPPTNPHGRHEAGVVIVGAGRAGWQMAASLRELDAGLPITIVAACAGDVYDKPLLSVAFAKQLGPAALAKESGASSAARLAVRLLAGTTAVRIERATKSLRTTRGTLRYRHLVLAHGAAPREVPALPGDLCWRINHLDAYRAFRQRLEAAGTPQRIVIAGAGLVGCELANDLALAGHAVTLVEPAGRPLAGLIDAAASAALLAAWSALPIRFVAGACIEHVSAGGSARTVRLADGRRIETDHVVSVTGLVTPSRLATSASLAWQDGIAVDAETLATSAADIHALGDCISIDGRPIRYIEPIARQSQVIAARIVGAQARAYANTRPPIRIKTTALPMTV